MIDLNKIVDDESANVALAEWKITAPAGIWRDSYVTNLTFPEECVIKLVESRHVSASGTNFAAADARR